MKYLLTVCFLALFLSLLTLAVFGQKKGDTTYFPPDTTIGFIIKGTGDEVFLFPAIKTQISYEVAKPCKEYYHWSGKGWYEYKEPGCDTKSKDDPCHVGCFYLAFPSEYKGDSILDTNCKTFEMGAKDVHYYKTDKTKKMGDEYIIQKGERFGIKQEWPAKYGFIICG